MDALTSVVRSLPTERHWHDQKRRRNLFSRIDVNGAELLSLSDLQQGLEREMGLVLTGRTLKLAFLGTSARPASF